MKTLSKFLLVFALLFGCTQIMNAQSKRTAPASADKVQNPYKGNGTATSEGKKLFTQLCVICHGNKGKGDGLAGMNLNPRPANFTSSKVQSQTDGAIYWKLTEGKPPMAPYKQALTDQQRWQLVNYIRH